MTVRGKRPRHIDDIPDEGSTQDETRVPDAREVYEKERKELERLNDSLSNYQSTSWINERIVKITAKRDRQEDLVRAMKKVCEDLGLIKAEQLDLPGVDTPHDKPRPHADRSTVTAEEWRALNGIERSALPSRQMAALPAPSSDCAHTDMADLGDGNTQCRACGLIDIAPTSEPPADEQPELPETPPKRGRAKKS